MIYPIHSKIKDTVPKKSDIIIQRKLGKGNHFTEYFGEKCHLPDRKKEEFTTKMQAFRRNLTNNRLKMIY